MFLCLLRKNSLPLPQENILDNFCPVFDLPFLAEIVVVHPLQWILGQVDYLDSFKSRFRPGFVMEIALDNIWLEWDKGSASIMVLLEFSAIDTMDHGSILNWF